jgi:hypothetical protein
MTLKAVPKPRVGVQSNGFGRAGIQDFTGKESFYGIAAVSSRAGNCFGNSHSGNCYGRRGCVFLSFVESPAKNAAYQDRELFKAWF